MKTHKEVKIVTVESTWHSRQKCAVLHTEIDADLSPWNEEVQISEIEDECKDAVPVK
jgi:hypothetical protein